MNSIKYYLLFLSAILFIGCNSNKETSLSLDEIKTSKSLSIDQKVEALLSKMTLEEKVGQMNQYNGFWDVTGPAPTEGEAEKKYEHLRKGYVGSMINVKGVKDVMAVQKIAVEETRLGIPLIIGFDLIHGYKTVSPIPLAEAASWDLEAIEHSAKIAAAEAAASGINWTFAPMVDISRDARWGRVMEGAGEDPFLGAKIGVARVNGFQGKDLSDPNTIAACAKHFAGYGFAESGKDYNTVDVGTSTLHNVILPPFKAVSDAGIKTFMNSFNELNGIPATGNSFFQRDILKNEWDFDGFIVSDWGSVAEMIPHGYAKDGKEAAKLAVNSGSDMDMESYLYVAHLVNLVNEGAVKESDIDDAVKRILKVKFELGLFDDPYKYCNQQREKVVIGSKEANDAVLDMAKKSIVLLKNENNLLPLKKEGQKIAVIGALASDKSSPLGNWRLAADQNTAVSLLEGLEQYPNNTITFSKGADLVLEEASFPMEVKINTSDTSGFAQAINVAKSADVVILALGEHGMQSGEGRSRANLDLPGVQQQLLEAVYKVNKNIVLVLQTGRPLAIEWADNHIPAIINAWHLGTQSGNAIAQVLYGDYNPSGKLPMTFPRNVNQVPIYYNYKNTGRPNLPGPNLVFWSHYTDQTNLPLYPFGYGLSYTNFDYKNLVVDNTYAIDQTVKVTLQVTNTGQVKGKEVVQLYLRDLFASVTRPVRELKGFELVELEPNQTKTITFTLSNDQLGFYDNNGKFKVENGDFEVFVGGSSLANLSKAFKL
ncbi:MULTISPECIES: beta-glucosidase BglX [Mesoflavibacter]|uniref:beta-glucosidase n=1 Tax=Mesoflavibacter profundi TaxID=2708110 RepID=A0ABT4RWX1_9FLAO|nr:MULTISPECIES: beta-glucosidase BglX [Mesoflavibacter]MDA0176329.1 beta-glucosidase BglX [Mesoflavibacter profundi]QIJ89969.1 beta-glucosidase [Mesoflavibacter sp. HG96]QIJ92697.1 beta-glucosidase [Mesoflavibacter sp. HG37]